jgi:hypothetical protein
MTTKDRLIAGRNRIEDPANWGQGLSFDRPGTFCAAEAVGSDDAAEASASRAAIGSTSLTRFNDTHTHAEVLAVYDRAIAAA